MGGAARLFVGFISRELVLFIQDGIFDTGKIEWNGMPEVCQASRDIDLRRFHALKAAFSFVNSRPRELS